MASGQKALGFGGGFMQGLAQVLNAKRQEKIQADERLREQHGAFFKFMMDPNNPNPPANVEDMNVALSGWLPEIYGEQAQKQKPKAGQVDHRGMINNILDQALQGQRGQPLAPGPSSTQPTPPSEQSDFAGPVEPTVSSRTTGPTSLPIQPKARETLGGISVLSAEEAQTKKIDRDLAARQALAVRSMPMIRQAAQALMATDPSLTYDEATREMTRRFGFPVDPILRSGLGTAQSVAGEIGGKPAFGVFDPATKTYLDPETHEPLKGFVPRTTTGSTSLGADRESVAREMFGKPAAQLTSEEMGKVNDQVETMAASKAGATTGARAEANANARLSTPERFQAEVKLRDEWRKAEEPVKEIGRQMSLMETALKRFEKDPVGSVEGVRVTFEKILDPNSVVREAEYARQGYGLSLLNRLEGFRQQMIEGGGNIPKPVLEGMVETARQFVKGMEDYNTLERERITESAKDPKYNIPLERIFGLSGAPASTGGAKPTPTPAQGGTPAGWQMDKQGNIYINGVLQPFK